MGLDLTAKLTDDVARRGFGVLWVFDEEGDAPDFAYTVGLWESCRHPEFVVVGLPQEASMHVMSQISRMVIAGERFSEGNRVRNVLERFDILIGPVDPKFIHDNMGQSVRFSGEPGLVAQQVLWPDRSGTFPSEVGFDPRLARRQNLR